MADDVLISDEISKDAAVAALESLQKKGMDLNPYSLADELEVDHRAIVGNGEIMQMLSYARGDVNGIVAAEYDKLLRRVTELEEAQKNGGDSSEEDSDELDEELERLREKNSKLEEQVKALENANQVLALSMQDLAVPKKEEQDSEDRYNEGFEAAKKEMEAAIASASDEAFLKGYDAAKEELKDSNSSEETDEERFNEGFEAARKSLEGELLKSKEESYK
ncbi:MAG: hypothetical protein K2X64_02215, partial [Rhodocyclaceae bacterium]|nr:hypothetical protein [Rhodocyclaceae bacterium]